jgi:hypothetical protein
MKKLALISLALASFGTAAAQPAAPAKAPAPAPVKAVTTTPPMADKKLAAPPAELTKLAKQLAGTWKCAGAARAGEGAESRGTVVHKVDTNLNKFWIQSTLTRNAPKTGPLKSIWFTTYDASKNKLYRTTMHGRGGFGTAFGTVTDTKISWEGEARTPAGEDLKRRYTEELVSPKEMKVSGESSGDGGKTWTKQFEHTCKK